ncbi:MAG: hypothetical protein IKB25_07070 [Lentisphaeria bacterium]|nr:hypothetical protein [Lentisphaeria bacterium]
MYAHPAHYAGLNLYFPQNDDILAYYPNMKGFLNYGTEKT